MTFTTLIRLSSLAILRLPPIRGLGLALEYGSRLFARTDAEIVSWFDGSLISANPSVTEGRRLLFTSRYHDVKERAFVRTVLRPGDYAIDLGANIGLYTLLFARMVGHAGKVTAIEAEPANAARLRRNIALNDYRQVEVIEKGASDKRETLKLHLSDENKGMHSFAVRPGGRSLSIDCLPLSELVDRKRRPRLLKIDIEGYEEVVMKTYHEMTETTLLPEFIMFEDWQELRQQTRALCEARGYGLIASAGPNLMMAMR